MVTPKCFIKMEKLVKRGIGKTADGSEIINYTTIMGKFNMSLFSVRLANEKVLKNIFTTTDN